MRRKSAPFDERHKYRRSLVSSEQDAGTVVIAASWVVMRYHFGSDRHGNVRSTARRGRSARRVLSAEARARAGRVARRSSGSGHSRVGESNWAGVHEQTPALLESRAKLSGIFAWHHGEITVELFCQAQAFRPRQRAHGFENLANGHGPSRISHRPDFVCDAELGR